MEMRRFIVEAIDRVTVGEVRENAWFGLFYEFGMVMLLKGVCGSRRATFFGDSLSRGTWHRIRVMAQVDNIWKTDPYVAKVEPPWKLWVYGRRSLVELYWS